jgi:hypothetical protein
MDWARKKLATRTKPSMNLPNHPKVHPDSYLAIRMAKRAHLCIDVNRCFPSMQVRNSDPSSDDDTAEGDKLRIYKTAWFVVRTEDYRWDIVIA